MDQPYHLLIIGSGAAGLSAAAAASVKGWKVLIVEKEEYLGGTTLLSGGTVWIPNNEITKQFGDTKANAKLYLKSAVAQYSDDHVESTATLRHEYLEQGPKMVSYLQEQGFRWLPSDFPDYQPKLPGASTAGSRTLNPDIFDAKELEPWDEHLELPPPYPGVRTFEDFRKATRPGTLSQNIPDSDNDNTSGCCKGLPVSMGCSLIAQLLRICKRNNSNGTSIWKKTEFVKFWLEEDRVVGAVLQKEAKEIKVRAHAVFLASAGFIRNQGMRDKYLPKNAKMDWSLTRPGGETGKVLQEAISIHARASLLQETWGIPTMADPNSGKMVPALFEISKPHCVVVDRGGHRFCNEARPYGDYVHSVFEKDVEARTAAWLILDSNYIRKYTLGSLPFQQNLDTAVEKKRLVKADSVSELGRLLEMQPNELTTTIQRWNRMCTKGVDTDFRRGEDEYQKFIGDETMKPNPNMGVINEPPFYALQIFPGDAGNKGGLLTDKKGRVLRKDGGVIKGLYASGNVSASLFGKASIGAGTTIGPAMTFAYIAVQHISEELEKGCHDLSE